MNTTLFLKDKNIPIVPKLSESTVKQLNSDILGEDTKYTVALEKRLLELTNSEEANTKSIELLNNYLKNKLSTHNEIESSSIPKSIVYTYLYKLDFTTLEELISQEIIIISSKEELSEAICIGETGFRGEVRSKSGGSDDINHFS